MAYDSIEKLKIDSELQAIWIDCSAAEKEYGPNTLDIKRKIKGAFKPESIQQIQSVISWAYKNKTQLAVFSTGKNWGYGSSLSKEDHVYLMDLSRLNKVLDYDENLGLVTVEPGVTQQILYEFLKQKGFKHMVPTTGAGPETSILGNALTKGVGLTPHEDHYSAIMSLEAVLPDGSLYKSAMHEFGGVKSNQIFKWKTGPVLEGLFAQSHLGIVTQATIALVRKPEKIEQYVAYIKSENLQPVVEAVRNIRQTLGSTSGGINIMGQRRVLALMDKDNEWPKTRAITNEELVQISQAKGLSDFVLVGALYGTTEMVAAGKKYVQQQLQNKTKKIKFFNREKLKWAKTLTKFLPLHSLRGQIDAAENSLDILEGKPSYYALKLAYIKNRISFYTIDKPHPDHDQCGIVWFAPLLPIEPKIVEKFNQQINQICLKYNFDPIVTFIAISDKCFDCTIPLIFDKTNPYESVKAYACRDELFKMAQQLQVFPHRMDVDMTKRMFLSEDIVAIEMYKKIKQVLDPYKILA